jgi:hypothetical protein
VSFPPWIQDGIEILEFSEAGGEEMEHFEKQARFF